MNEVCDKTKVNGIGTKAMSNRPADSEADGSGAHRQDARARQTRRASAPRHWIQYGSVKSLYFSRYSSRYLTDVI